MIFVVGAGWYGCHVASELLKAGQAVVLVDKTNAFFAGSSGKNQNRLHLGYHYPRSAATISECRRGFQEFKATYPGLSSRIPNNLYLLASSSKTSVVDFSTTFDTSGTVLQVAGTPFRRVEGVEDRMFVVEEEYIDNEAAAAMFRTRLSPHFQHLPPESFASLDTLRTALSVGEEDWIINCTYNQLAPIPMDHYELYCSFVYSIPGPLFAITVMDGAYFSIYPYDLEKQLYTVTSVCNGVVRRDCVGCDGCDHVRAEEKDIAVRRATVEAEVSAVLPEFPTIASYHSHFLSWKCKPVTEEDDRSLRHSVEDRVISLYGGKITGIFDAARIVLATTST